MDFKCIFKGFIFRFTTYILNRTRVDQKKSLTWQVVGSCSSYKVQDINLFSEEEMAQDISTTAIFSLWIQGYQNGNSTYYCKFGTYKRIFRVNGNCLR